MYLLRKATSLASLLVTTFSCHMLNGELIDANDDSDNKRIIEIASTDQFSDVIGYIQSYLNEEAFQSGEDVNVNVNHFTLDITVHETGIAAKIAKRGKNSKRNYFAPVTAQEKKDIRYLITTLARDSLVSIGNSKSSLKKAGDRIDHVHPLKFLTVIFTDEELKAGIRAIRDRGWIWDDFSDGLIDTLKEEAANNNMKLEFIQDFTLQIGVNPALVLPYAQAGRWKDFVNILIDNVPRVNDPNRYNM